MEWVRAKTTKDRWPSQFHLEMAVVMLERHLRLFILNTRTLRDIATSDRERGGARPFRDKPVLDVQGITFRNVERFVRPKILTQICV
jgi:hypothetical protein